jgi:hypothetical protein
MRKFQQWGELVDHRAVESDPIEGDTGPGLVEETHDDTFVM